MSGDDVDVDGTIQILVIAENNMDPMDVVNPMDAHKDICVHTHAAIYTHVDIKRVVRHFCGSMPFMYRIMEMSRRIVQKSFSIPNKLI